MSNTFFFCSSETRVMFLEKCQTLICDFFSLKKTKDILRISSCCNLSQYIINPFIDQFCPQISSTAQTVFIVRIGPNLCNYLPAAIASPFHTKIIWTAWDSGVRHTNSKLMSRCSRRWDIMNSHEIPIKLSTQLKTIRCPPEVSCLSSSSHDWQAAH